MLTQEKVRRLFKYKDGRLYWIKSPCNPIKAGQRAGAKGYKQLYWSIMIDDKHILEHRLIFLYFNGFLPKQIDHISDVLTDEGIKDNHIENLRPTTNGANVQKSTKVNGNSKYRGVRWRPNNKKWVARARLNYKLYHLGYFTNEVEAALAYDEFIISHRDEHSFLNFPERR